MTKPTPLWAWAFPAPPQNVPARMFPHPFTSLPMSDGLTNTRTTEPAEPASPEQEARKTIDHLLHGKLVPRTIDDLGKAVGRAKQDSAIGHMGRLRRW
jgi:hypothetical protein